MMRAAVLALLLAVVAGCGGGNLGFETTPTPTATPTPTVGVQVILNCPGFSPTVEIIDGTPVTIFDARCTPTPAP